MFISFIIPHYNLPFELLQRCVDSILKQEISHIDYEIIVVDDGSDNTPDWVVNKRNTRLIKTKHNGLGSARNIGLENAKGKYIQFVDSDDCLIIGSMQYCMELLNKEKPDILQHGYRICHSNKDCETVFKTNSKHHIYKKSAIYMANRNLYGNVYNYIFKKELSDKYNIRFQPGVLHEDEDFTTFIYFYGNKLVQCNFAAYNYCIREGSITANKDPEHEKKRIEDLFALLSRVSIFKIKEQNRCSQIQKKAITRKLIMLAVDTILNLFYNGKNYTTIRHICLQRLKTLNLYPLPYNTYSFKYIVFRTFVNNVLGLRLLRILLPSRKPQR